ncbi:MAG: saccharopine dehydrogenase C-terminal domain-containing protein [Thermodesulfobacteriota bacterium]|nr:saccharopine dehydrogenase C-terminal domain-containing protein [Thermodesulfobacteriota bacterium]
MSLLIYENFRSRSGKCRLRGMLRLGKMSRAVSLSAAIASKLIIEGKIKAKGVQRPTLPEFYQPVLKEMGEFGYHFVHNRIKL